jgi:hypothetical protein
MRYSLLPLPLLVGLTACTIERPAPVQHTTYVTPPTTTYVPAAPSTLYVPTTQPGTVVQTPY